MDKLTSEIDTILRKVVLRYFYTIIIVFSLFSVYYWINDVKPFKYIASLVALLHIGFVLIPYKLEYESIKKIIPIYLVFVSVALYPIVMVFWQMDRVIVFMWYFLIPIGAMVFFNTRIVVYWVIYIALIILSIFFISAFLPQVRFSVNIDQRVSSIINIGSIMLFLFLFAFFVYYIHKINQLKIRRIQDIQSENIPDLDVRSETLTSESRAVDKFESLYKNILDFFEKEKPYCNPDFTISQLATAVNSNVKYISKAIHIYNGINFSVFINTYRVNKIKDMFDNGYQNKFTMTYIYTSAGFRYQSTFNKVFKQIVGITPTEYIKNLI